MTLGRPIRAPRRLYPGASKDNSPAPFLTSRQVAELTGATLRQLLYWRALGLTKPLTEVASFYDQAQVRRVEVVTRIASTLAGIRHGGRQYRLNPLKRITDSALARSFLLFSPQLSLLLATDDKREAIRIATAAAGGVLLVELPALAGERAGAARG